MNQLAIYILFVFIYLGVSRVVTPSSQVSQYVHNELNYSAIFSGAPVAVILEDAYRMGFVIKSNVHRYRVVRVFEGSKIVTVHVSSSYFQETLGYIGLSLFRRNGKGMENTTPLPPGSLFVGDLAYGSWDIDRDGIKRWAFFGAYRFLHNEFSWGDFRPDDLFYRELKTHLENGREFFGPNHEFGSEGSITRSQLPLNWYRGRDSKFSLRDYIRDYMGVFTSLP